MSIRAILFDWDGTLTHGTNELWLSANNQIIQSHGSEAMSMEVFARLGFGTDIAKMLAYLDIDPGKAKHIDITRNEIYNVMLRTQSAWIPGGKELLQTVRATGRKIGMITHARSRNLAVQEERLQWQQYFDVVVSKDDMEKEGRNLYKPHPFSVRHAAEKLQIPIKECCYVGDLETDMLTAKNAGIDSILLQGDLSTPEAIVAATYVYSSAEECRRKMSEWLR